MHTLNSDQITEILKDLSRGDPSAQSRLSSVIYPELRKIAARCMRGERSYHTLQATALVNEAYLRLVGQACDWQNRSHFFAVAAHIMRSILVDHARRRGAAKRGAGAQRVQLDDFLAVDEEALDLILAVDHALERLASLDPRQAEVVILRFFGGLEESEIAHVLRVSTRTVKRDWRMAKAWLHGVLQ